MYYKNKSGFEGGYVNSRIQSFSIPSPSPNPSKAKHQTSRCTYIRQQVLRGVGSVVADLLGSWLISKTSVNGCSCSSAKLIFLIVVLVPIQRCYHECHAETTKPKSIDHTINPINKRRDKKLHTALTFDVFLFLIWVEVIWECYCWDWC